MKLDFKGLNMLHGADYNPEQWLEYPDVLREDVRLMKQAGINCASIGIFSWACLEPEEGVYTLDWLRDIIEKLYQNDIHTILATPSGARPAWMAQKYPEVLRVGPDLERNHFGGRHNHCYTSPVYRQKTREINTGLAQAFGNHPGVILWHLSNEYGGACYCPLCQAAFRKWLREKYGTLDALNHAWWTRFWSHSYSDWEQIEPPLPHGESGVQGQLLDWKRFVTGQTVDFFALEKEAVRAAGSALPVTANMMEFYEELDYSKFADVLDIASWDSYPRWHGPAGDVNAAVRASAFHDIMRCLKQQPFLLMESTPSMVNWSPVSKLKKPGMHMLSSMLAVAHGSDSVQYFQWRKSRGGFEKFHGAVVSHDGRSDTRVFRDVAEVGARLQGLADLCGTMPKAQVALLFDWENWWALEGTRGPRNMDMPYVETVLAHYKAFWQQGIPVDVVDVERPLDGYRLVVAPMLYMYRAGIGQRLQDFVRQGGTLVASCMHGMVDESDLCFLGNVPAGNTALFGLWVEEVDGLYPTETNGMHWNGRAYALKELCERIHLDGAEQLACYERDFYKGEPVLACNRCGSGAAYYLAANAEDAFYYDFYAQLAGELGLETALQAALPERVSATWRGEAPRVVVVQNFNHHSVNVPLAMRMQDYETGETLEANLPLKGYETRFVVRHP